MKKTTKMSLVALMSVGAAVFGACMATSNPTATTQVELTVSAGDLTIEIEDSSITIPGVTSSFEAQTKTGEFTNYFWVSDLKGSASGYYTTIQVSDLTGKVDSTEYKIDASNVSFKRGSGLNLLSGATNSDVKIDNFASYTVISGAVTYIERAANTTPGVLSKYGDKPSIQVVVPANTPTTKYVGTLTYTLIERS